MAPLGDFLYAYLASRTEIAAVVGSRIYSLIMPANPVYPNITYQEISITRYPTFAGRTDLSKAYYQIDCWAKDGGGQTGQRIVQDLATKVFLALEGYRGILHGVNVQGILEESELLTYESEVAVARAIHTYKIMYLQN